MSNKLIMTADFGTQSVRASVFDAEGKSLAMVKKDYKPAYFSNKPNYAEQDPDYYHSCLCDCIKEITEKHPEIVNDIAALTVTCFRDTAVMLDKDGKVIRPSILWLDQRNAVCKEKLPLIYRMLFALVGKTETIVANRKRSMANWIQENEPENWKNCAKWLPIQTYFIYRMTGEMKDIASSASGHYPINFKKGAFYKDPMKHMQGMIFGIRKDQLPTLVKPGETVGSVTEAFAKETGLPVGIPVYSAGSDKSCETLGVGVIDSSMAAFSYGTACTVETTVSKYVESEPFLPAFPSPVKGGGYNMDVQIYRGYWMVNWFLKEFAGQPIDDIMSGTFTVQDLNKHLKDVRPGCDGLVLQPYWGPGLARPLAKGAVIGWSDATTMNHFYRAIIEGIAFALKESFVHFEKKLHKKIPVIRISGGGSNSDEICQITADILGRKVVRVQTAETTSLGAAIAGFMAIGEYKTVKDATEKMVSEKDAFVPNPDHVATYDYIFRKVYMKMYPSMKDMYKNIKAFNRYEEKLIK